MSSTKLAAAAILLLVARSGLAGSLLEIQTTEHRGATPTVGKVDIWASAPMSRIDIVTVDSSESGTMIFNSDISELVVVDNDNRNFYVLDQAQIDAIAAQIDEQNRQLEEALAEMPPDQAAIARRMANLPEATPEPPPPTLQKTGESDSIADHDCDYYDVISEGRRIRDLCVTDWDDIREGKETAGALISLGNFFENMRRAFRQSGGTSLMDRQQDLFGYMDELDGYPVLSRDYDSAGNIVYESRLMGSRHEDVDPDVFSRPAGYQERSLMSQ